MFANSKWALSFIKWQHKIKKRNPYKTYSSTYTKITFEMPQEQLWIMIYTFKIEYKVYGHH